MLSYRTVPLLHITFSCDSKPSISKAEADAWNLRPRVWTRKSATVFFCSVVSWWKWKLTVQVVWRDYLLHSYTDVVNSRFHLSWDDLVLLRDIVLFNIITIPYAKKREIKKSIARFSLPTGSAHRRSRFCPPMGPLQEHAFFLRKPIESTRSCLAGILPRSLAGTQGGQEKVKTTLGRR